jgi:putative transposase
LSPQLGAPRITVTNYGDSLSFRLLMPICYPPGMARFARVVVPRLPHYVTQQGNRRQPIFFEDGDYELYRDLLAERCREEGVEVWAYCLLPDRVHLILVPREAEGLRRAVGEAHRRYTAFVNLRARQSGHLFRSRFASVVLDEPHLRVAARYMALGPLRARLAARARDWPWSSFRAHLAKRDDGLVRVRPLLERMPDLAALVAGGRESEADRAAFAALRLAESTGRPLGGPAFVRRLERRLGRPLAPRKPGRPPQDAPKDKKPRSTR